MKSCSTVLKQLALACICSLLILGCGSSESSSSSSPSSPSSASSPSPSPNGTYTYTESGGVLSVVTVSGARWSSSLKICEYCDKSYSSGIVKDGKLYDSSGFVEVGSVSGSSLSMRMPNGYMTHRK